MSVCTLVLWLSVLTVGILGIYLPYSRPAPIVPEPPAVQAEMLNVELTDSAPTPLFEQKATDLSEPPPMSDQFIASDVPPMIAVAEPTAVAFALPVEGSTRLVEAKNASYAKPVVESTATARPNTATSAPATQRLVFGEGEGKQPGPNYPRQALREGQQGVVTVRFNVGETGHVLAAEVAVPSPWKLLNEAAAQVVRERWRFRTGPRRLYEVAIRFNLQN